MVLLMFLMFVHLMKIKSSYLCFLIGLEFISSTLLFFLVMNSYEMWMFMFLMIYMVCEAVFGMSLLVGMNFMVGHDKIDLMEMC